MMPIHTHAVKLMTFTPGKACPKSEMVFIPDKTFHELRKYLEKVAIKEVE